MTKHRKGEVSLCGSIIPHCWNQASYQFKILANKLFDDGYLFETFMYTDFSMLVYDLAKMIQCRLLTSRDALGILFPEYRLPGAENFLLHHQAMLFDKTCSRNFSKFFKWLPKTDADADINPLLI